ncbi:MAG: Eco57I restriction-modification methylase domain-containing protein [Geopsychrobacter sp.]|nr:Eco57I restriction-modification methylase domain-containing protein [Geopsychrobacter sp.]
MELKTEIQQCLQAFSGKDLRTAAIGLLNTLGYQSEKTLDLGGSPEAFLEQFDNDPDRAFRKDKALFEDWQEIQLLFQLTDQELSGQNSLFVENEVKQGVMNSYLFFALRLKEATYTRGKLAQITRQLNRLFPMPVMVFFEYDGQLSIAVINRRGNKRDSDNDVLGKVTFIQGISLAAPHRGHLDILASFSISALTSKTGINSFDALHAAWEEVFNVELLNKKFYRELSNWYFWAMQHVHFPFDNAELDKDQLFKDDDKIREHDAKNLIRLLTRLLFVWFIKEKGLIPESLFDSDKLKSEVLNDFDDCSADTRFYKAILQNLFFATLNQSCGKRQFRNPGRQHRNITTLMRYQQYFQDSDSFIALVESAVPFMNGGLFECLDMPHPTKKGPQGGDVILFEDGFSDRDDNVLRVPDFLFYGKQKNIDLSGVYGDNKRKKEKVLGLIHILNSYKFTIVENTPIEQEIALDPELLGKVFENLLASYNPETKTTARKQTGSFYTPRTIVDYMVDESLKAYLSQALCKACPEVTEGDAKEGLDILFSYSEKEHVFSEAEKLALITAIDNCKILDPACGSGAFPMGILHKLEFILGKLDKNNKLWRDRQIGKVNDTIAVAEQIDDAVIRENTVKDLEAQKEDVEEAFSQNDLGYGRKLYLIENCIYGVDIQSIATQVSKLRFFISLIVEQGINPDKENFGIRPLPNLEAKFTTADTLIPIEKPADQGELFESKKVKDLEKELKQIRHNLFNAKTPKTKNKYRLRDKELREQIAAELEVSGWSSASARQLSQWDPYDQNASSPFFDAEWMYGISDGFDVVIGNPPYISVEKFSGTKQQEVWKKIYTTYAARGDVYCFFYERGAQLLRPGGHLCYITSNKWMRAGYGEKLRALLSSAVDTKAVLDFGMAQNFGAATTYTNILNFENIPTTNLTQACYAADDNEAMADPGNYFRGKAVLMPELSENAWVVVTPERYRIKKLVELQGVPLGKWNLNINYGIKTGLNDAFFLTHEQVEDLIDREPRGSEIIVPLLRGRHIDRYRVNYDALYMLLIKFGAYKTLEQNYPAVYSHLKKYEAALKKRGQCKYSRAKKGTVNQEYPGQHHWLELDNNITDEYIEAFRQPKIIYPNMTKYLPFYYDQQDHFFINDKAFIMTSDSESLPYLTAVLNSSLFRCCFRDNFPELLGNSYEVRKVFVDKIPIKKSDAMTVPLFEILVNYIQFVKADAHQSTSDSASAAVIAAFLEEVIDACVMEVYFAEHMRERKLNLMDHVRSLLPADNDQRSDSEKWHTITAFFEQANTLDHPIRNRLMRIISDSPELLAVIKKEGKV